MKPSSSWRTPGRERGIVTLAIGMLLLALIVLVTLFGGRLQVLEQRVSANDYRARVAFGAAEAGFNRGLEYLKANRAQVRSTGTGGWLEPGAELWTAVDCDAPPGQVETDACTKVSSALQRQSGLMGTVYFYGDVATEDLPNATPLSNGAVYTADYALCARGDAWSEPCAADVVGADDISVVILSTGFNQDPAVFPDGVATASIRQLVGTFGIIPGNALPPLMAAGTISGSGTFDVVVNPNGGGPGIPLSAWSNDDLDLTGAATMCQVDEYFSTGAETVYAELPETSFRICENCSCPVSTALTRTENNIYYEGIDIVDVDGNVGPTPDATNFPDDVFEYIFGVAHEDYQEIKERAEVIADCTGLDGTAAGVYWLTGPCSINQTVGHPEHPVMLISESSIDIQGGGEVFGLAYAFSYPPDGIAGGDVTLRGGTRFYGAIVSDHEIDIGNGTFQLIYSDDLLSRILTDDDFKSFGRVPGTWADHVD